MTRDGQLYSLKRRIQFMSKPLFQQIGVAYPMGQQINERMEISPGQILHSLRWPTEVYQTRQWRTTVTDEDGNNYTQNDVNRPFIQDLTSTTSALRVYEWWLKNRKPDSDLNVRFLLEKMDAAVSNMALSAIMLREREGDAVDPEMVLTPYFLNVPIPATGANFEISVNTPVGKNFYINSMVFNDTGPQWQALGESLIDFKCRQDWDENGLTRQPILGFNILSSAFNFMSYPGWPGHYPIPRGETAILTITTGVTPILSDTSLTLVGWAKP